MEVAVANTANQGDEFGMCIQIATITIKASHWHDLEHSERCNGTKQEKYVDKLCINKHALKTHVVNNHERILNRHTLKLHLGINYSAHRLCSMSNYQFCKEVRPKVITFPWVLEERDRSTDWASSQLIYFVEVEVFHNICLNLSEGTSFWVVLDLVFVVEQ